MKCVVAILAVALASQCLSAPVNDDYADLIQAVLAYAKQQLSEHDPMSLPDVKNEKIQDENVNLVMSQTNTQLSKASTFTVEEVSTNPTEMSAKIRVNIPEFIQSGLYEVSGTAYDRAVSGKGSIAVVLQDFDQSVDATFVNPDTSLQLSSLTLNYDLSNVNVTVTGLNIAGMTPAQVQQFISQDFTAMIMGQKAQVEKLTAAVAMSKINELIAGKTLAEVVAWVKSQIHQ